MSRPHDGSADVTSIDVARRPAPAQPAEIPSLSSLPLMLTVDEAANVLRISRSTAYKLIEENRATGGHSGLPHVRLGSRCFVRRVDLAMIVGVDPSS
jgi:excisionase family DNA binding protein